LRLGVYGEFGYRADGDRLYSDQSFALFVVRLAEFVERLVIVGRLSEEPGRSHHPLRGDFEFVALPYYSSLANLPRALWAALRSVPRLWRSLDSVDAVWLLGPNPLCLLFAALARLRRRRVVLGVRQDIVALTRSRYGRGVHLLAAILLERAWRLLARRNTIVAVGPELAEQYERGRRVVPISVSLVDEAQIAAPELAAQRDYGGELTVLSVGRLEPQKNPLLLADVLRELRQGDDRWRLVVCGSGSMEEQLAERVRELGLGEFADLRGYVPVDGDLARLYRDSHLFLHVSWTEGFPQVLIESFAAALPVVATAVGGIEGWVGGAAVLVPPGDAAAAATALRRLADDVELRARVVADASRFVAKHTVAAECQRVVEACA
jgi:glycosyltransferase involved in cell wall biosynthesis